MSDLLTRFHFDNDAVTVERVQDVEDIIEYNKLLRDQSQVGADFHQKWSLPNVMIERFYLEYAGDNAAPPMNGEFWAFVDKKMNDPDYAKFRTDNPSSPFFIGYRK